MILNYRHNYGSGATPYSVMGKTVADDFYYEEGTGSDTGLSFTFYTKVFSTVEQYGPVTPTPPTPTPASSRWSLGLLAFLALVGARVVSARSKALKG